MVCSRAVLLLAVVAAAAAHVFEAHQKYASTPDPHPDDYSFRIDSLNDEWAEVVLSDPRYENLIKSKLFSACSQNKQGGRIYSKFQYIGDMVPTNKKLAYVRITSSVNDADLKWVNYNANHVVECMFAMAALGKSTWRFMPQYFALGSGCQGSDYVFPSALETTSVCTNIVQNPVYIKVTV